MGNEKSFEAARAESIAANRDFIQANPEPLKRLYSHADDITIFGDFGGLERGWAETEPRLNWRPRSSPAEVSKNRISA
jgi:hypothetical protein